MPYEIYSKGHTFSQEFSPKTQQELFQFQPHLLRNVLLEYMQKIHIGFGLGSSSTFRIGWHVFSM